MSLSSKAQHFSYKTLLLIIVFLLIPIVFLLRLNQRVNPASAEWWNDSWSYRQAINIATHTVGETNVYIIASVNIGTTTKVQADDGDFRFTTFSGQLLDYYISADAGSTAPTFHINFTSFPSDAQTIYAYYGNPSAQNGFALSDFSTEASNYSFGSAASEELGGDPVAYWKFDEGVGTSAYDSSSNRHDGSLKLMSSPPTDSSSWQTEDKCISKKCLGFDGIDDYVSVGTGNNYFPLPLFSICAWAKSPGLAPGMTIDGIFSLTYGLGFRLDGSGRFNTYMDDGVNAIYTTVTGNLFDNKFHHLCLTYDGTNRHMYVDGTKKLTQATTWLGTTKWPTNGANIGHDNNNPAISKFNGVIDEPKIYPYARTAAEIKQDYNLGAAALVGHKQEIAQVTPLKSKLVTHYKFDEGYGTTTKDSGPNSYTASFGIGSSAPTWTNDGQFGRALIYDGLQQSIYINTVSALNGLTSLSVSAWVYPTAHAGTGCIYSRGSSSYAVGFFHFCKNASGQLYLDINDTPNAHKYSTGNNVLTLNTWNYVSLVIDGTNIYFYINGKLDKSDTFGGMYPLINGSTTGYGRDNIGGKFYTSMINFFQGGIDDVKVYNSALTADEIKLDYNQGSAMQLGSLSSGTGNTAPSSAASQEYCVPGDGSTCSPPIAEWKFEEGLGTTAYDTSGNGNNGAWNGTGTHWDTGKYGKAGKFNGSDDYVDIPTVTLSDVTVNGWFNHAQGGISPNDIGTIVSLEESLGLFRVEISNNQLNLYVYDGSTHTIGLTTINNSQWYFFSAIKQGNLFSFYINGVLVDSYTTAGSISAGDGINAIGERKSSGTWQYHFNGLIDQVKIYNYTRSPAQIAWDYNQGAPVAQYKFDECQGTVAHDSIGTNNGTINIGASVPQTTVGTCNIGTTDSAWFNGATGKTNASLNFDGSDDDISLASDISLPPANSSVSWWMKRPVSRYETIFSRARNGTCGYISVSAANGITIESFTNNIWQKTLATGINTSDNVWHHYTLSFSPTDSSLYVDGKIASSTTANSDTANFVIRYFGSYQLPPSYGTWLNGQIDDVQIFNYALTATQVKTVYNDGAVNFR